jgi:hypothetical protein
MTIHDGRTAVGHHRRGVKQFDELYSPLATERSTLDNGSDEGTQLIADGGKNPSPAIVDNFAWGQIKEMGRHHADSK